jgi:hypothetical protein
MKEGSGVKSASSAGNRTELWAEGVEKLFKKPLGWRSTRHHHNLWLDMAKHGSIFPLLFFLISNFNCYKDLKKVLKYSGPDLGINVTFIAIFLATFLFFFTEPVIVGNFFSIVIFCLFFGILRGYLLLKVNQKKVRLTP